VQELEDEVARLRAEVRARSAEKPA
jgi:hypothetical protein